MKSSNTTKLWLNALGVLFVLGLLAGGSLCRAEAPAKDLFPSSELIVVTRSEGSFTTFFVLFRNRGKAPLYVCQPGVGLLGEMTFRLTNTTGRVLYDSWEDHAGPCCKEKAKLVGPGELIVLKEIRLGLNKYAAEGTVCAQVRLWPVGFDDLLEIEGIPILSRKTMSEALYSNVVTISLTAP